LSIFGCYLSPSRNPLPGKYKDVAQIPFIPDARFWGDVLPSELNESLEEKKLQIKFRDPDAKYKPITYLALSGGGENGAFGAGLLVGWTETGKRPEFRAVAGISTGALAAPFAFLGPDYDYLLKKLYTTFSTDELMNDRPYLSIITADSLKDTYPMRRILSDIIDGSVMEKIAIEHNKGRRLFIGTTNLDAMRPVTWDIGDIARSGAPDALNLLIDVLMASSAIPGIFPPVYIKVKANGQYYDEIHVDGGAASQVFLYPASLDLQWMAHQVGLVGEDHIYVIRNSRLDAEWKSVKPKIFPVIERSIQTLIRTQGIGDLYRIFLGARRDELDYNLAYIPSDFALAPDEKFDPKYMQKLFNLGYQMAKNGYPWEKAPPGFAPPSRKIE
jgi:predicted acylesterase/phospholipase RssA